MTSVPTDADLDLLAQATGARLVIAAGIEPAKSTLYVQSHVPAHAELAWILSTLTALATMLTGALTGLLLTSKTPLKTRRPRQRWEPQAEARRTWTT